MDKAETERVTAMVIDSQTPCPMCPRLVRDLYALGWRVLATELSPPRSIDRDRLPEFAELLAALEALRPWYEAHHADQRHAFSEALESAREARLDPPAAATGDTA
jgi:hypothetical protein